MVNEEAMMNMKMEKTMLAALVAVFGTVAAVLTLLSQPGAEVLAGCGAVVLTCALGVVLLIRRPVWQAELTEQGVQCREMKSGETKQFKWGPYRRAYEMRTSRGHSCLMLTTGERTRSELIRAYRRCNLTGCCVTDGCVCVPGYPGPEALAVMNSRGIRVESDTVRLFIG